MDRTSLSVPASPFQSTVGLGVETVDAGEYVSSPMQFGSLLPFMGHAPTAPSSPTGRRRSIWFEDWPMDLGAVAFT